MVKFIELLIPYYLYGSRLLIRRIILATENLNEKRARRKYPNHDKLYEANVDTMDRGDND